MFRRNALCFAAFLVAAAAAASAATSQEVRVTWKSLKDVRAGGWEAKCVYPQFGGNWAVARQASAWASGFARTQMDGFLKDARRSASGYPPPPGPYYLQNKAIVALARPELFSLYFDTEYFTGGAHPGRTFEPKTFGVVGARTRALKLQDLFVKGVNARQVVSELVIPRLDAMGATWVSSGEMTNLSADQAEQFVVTPSGISFLLQPYEAGTWADGAFVVKVPFRELEGKLDANGPLKSLLKR